MICGVCNLRHWEVVGLLHGMLVCWEWNWFFWLSPCHINVLLIALSKALAIRRKSMDTHLQPEKKPPKKTKHKHIDLGFLLGWRVFMHWLRGINATHNISQYSVFAVVLWNGIFQVVCQRKMVNVKECTACYITRVSVHAFKFEPVQKTNGRAWLTGVPLCCCSCRQICLAFDGVSFNDFKTLWAALQMRTGMHRFALWKFNQPHKEGDWRLDFRMGRWSPNWLLVNS